MPKQRTCVEIILQAEQAIHYAELNPLHFKNGTLVCHIQSVRKIYHLKTNLRRGLSGTQSKKNYREVLFSGDIITVI